jgi:hypothetical protein
MVADYKMKLVLKKEKKRKKKKKKKKNEKICKTAVPICSAHSNRGHGPCSLDRTPPFLIKS